MRPVRFLGSPALLALLVACDPKRARGEPCEDAGDCDTGERCYQQVSEAGEPLGGPVCAVCEEQGGEVDGVRSCLELEVDGSPVPG